MDQLKYKFRTPRFDKWFIDIRSSITFRRQKLEINQRTLLLQSSQIWLDSSEAEKAKISFTSCFEGISWVRKGEQIEVKT